MSFNITEPRDLITGAETPLFPDDEQTTFDRTKNAIYSMIGSIGSRISDWQQNGFSRQAKAIGLSLLVLSSSAILANLKLNNRRFESPQSIEPQHLEEMTNTLRKVGERLQYKDADKLTIDPQLGRTGMSSLFEIDEMQISRTDYQSFIGKGPFTKAEITGIFAHEVSHRILGHPESHREFSNNLYMNNSENGLDLDSIRDIETMESSRAECQKMQDKINAYSRANEREADLYPMPYHSGYARGLRDALVRFHNHNPSDYAVTHPSVQERIAYVTESICRIYPDENRDIC